MYRARTVRLKDINCRKLVTQEEFPLRSKALQYGMSILVQDFISKSISQIF